MCVCVCVCVWGGGGGGGGPLTEYLCILFISASQLALCVLSIPASYDKMFYCLNSSGQKVLARA